MLTGLLAGCALPSLKDRSQSVAFVQAQTADTRLGSAVGREIEAHPDLSGITTLEDITGGIIMCYNLFMTVKRSPAVETDNSAVPAE